MDQTPESIFQTAQPNREYFEVKDVEPREVWEKRGDVALIDVRQLDEFIGELGHIPGAKLIPLDTLPDRTGELPRDRIIVFICRGGPRSARATAWALSEGYVACNMKGGMLLWRKNNLEIDTL